MPATKTSSTTRKDANLELIQHDIEELKITAKEHQQVLVGKDGNPGVVGHLAAMVIRMEALEKLFHNDLCHIQAKIDLMFAGKSSVEQAKDENSVKWTEIMKEWVKPVIVAIITAALVYFIVANGIAM